MLPALLLLLHALTKPLLEPLVGKLARKLYAAAIGSQRMSFAAFAYCLEVGFMLTENLLFFIFLFGMTSGVRILELDAPPEPLPVQRGW